MSNSVVALRPKVKHPAETITYGMSFAKVLESGELVSGVTSVVDPSSTLTISENAVTTGSILDDDGNIIPTAEAITFKVAGGVKDVDYRLVATITTTFNSNPGNTRVGVGILQVRDGMPS
jgi:hypothetical protein